MSFISSLASYRDLPGLWGRSFLIVAFLGRLPTSMTVIGSLTMVTAVHGIAAASISSAILAVSMGVANLLVGRWTDIAGQRLPLLILAPINTVALLAFTWAAWQGQPLAVLAVLCAVIGASTVPVGGLVRVRWYPVARTPKTLQTALSYETVADELMFVLGPAAVGILASALNPAVPLLLTAALVATCVTAFALHPSAPLGSRQSSDDDARHSPSIAFVLKAVAVSVGCFGALGIFFGSMQTSTTESATIFGDTGAAGLIYAAMGFGAAVTALAAPAIPDAITHRTRIVIGGIGMAAGTLAAPHAGSPVILALILVATGAALGPASVAIFTLTGERSPKGGDGVAMTALGAANVIGTAVGAAAAGQLLTRIGLAAGFAVSTVAALLIAAIAFVGLRARAVE